ncbi:5472_t:CDS:2, partial [Dentiscutata heterogama]
EICKIVPFQKRMDKINIHSYLMVKDKYHEDTYYWCCEKKKSLECKGRAITKFINKLYYLKQFTAYNHSPQASSAKNLDDIDISDLLCLILNKENFLVRDSIIGEDRIILFTTKANIQHLSRALYWIIDNNLRVLLLVYALMIKKSEELYRALFQDLIEFAEKSNILLRPTTIFTDFELAAINASYDEFPEYGLSTQYSTDEKLSINLRQLFALAFLPSKEIPTAFDILKEKMLPETNEIVQCEKQIQKSPKHQTQRRTNTRKDRMSKTPNLAKNKYKKGENVQSTKPGKEQTQESPKHQTRRRTSTRKSKTPNPMKNKHKKVQSTKPGEEQTNTSRERKSKSPFL